MSNTIINCQVCFEKFKNNGEDNYGFGYYVKRLGDKMLCGDCIVKNTDRGSNESLIESEKST